jgi:hypothetical protein
MSTTRFLLFALVLAPFSANAQTTVLQSDDGTMEQMWSLTSPNAGPGDWVAVGYVPPIEFPFRVVSATMNYLDTFCCSGSTCSNALCTGGADWEQRIIARQNLAVDSAGLTPDLAFAIAGEANVAVDAGSTATSPPWTMSPNTWTLPNPTVFDSPGRIFYAVKYFSGDEWMRFAVDNSGNAGTSLYTTDNFVTRSAIWSFGNIGMRISVQPIFNLKIASNQPAASFQLASSQRVVMLALRVGAGNAATSITNVRVSASGSGNDQSAISAVRLVLDADRDGIEDTGETTLASGVYAANNGTVNLNPNRTIAQGSSEQWLVVYDFNSAPLGGDTFTARIASSADVTSSLGAPYNSGTAGGTGALSSNAVTIAGRLSVSRGPNSMASRIVAAGTTGLATLQLRLNAENETFTVSSLAINADGTLNDLTNVSAVRLYQDTDNNGLAGGSDVLLATDVYTQDNGRLVFNMTPLTVPANSTRDLLVALDLSVGASGGETVRTIVSSAADLVASGATSGTLPLTGPRALSGTPVIGNIATIGGALAVSLGAATPGTGTAQPSASEVPMLQVTLSAQSENVAVSALTFSASGSGDEVAHVSRARLHRDTNGNGLRDAGDVLVGQPQAYAANNGVVTFALAPELITAGQSRSFLLTYDFTSAPTGGETFAVRLASASEVLAEGQASGAPISATGPFPLNGATRTMLGGLSIALGPQNPAATNVQPSAADFPVLQLFVQGQGEAFTIGNVRFTATGSLHDATGIAAIELWRDLGTAGVRDAADVLLGTGTFPADDAVAAIAVNQTLAAGTNERWLLTYDLSALPAPGQTFRASLSQASDVAATGSLSGVIAPSGLPLSGATHAIGGTITLSLGPGNPLGGSIGASQLGVVMAQLRMTATLEPITVSSLTLSASGTGNDQAAISAVRLWLDADQDGVLDIVGDVALGLAQTYALDDGRVTINFAPRTIAAGGREDLLVVYDLSGSASAGSSFAVSVTGGGDVTATAPSGIVPRALGTPISSNTRIVRGSLNVSRGANTPTARTVVRNALSVPLFQIRLVSQSEAFNVSELAFDTLGSIDDVGDVSAFMLYDDVDGNGAVSAADLLIQGSVSPAGDDGTLTFGALSLALPANTTRNLLVAANLSGSALGGATLRLSMSGTDAILATGINTRPVTATGLPISSETLTTGGTLNVGLGVASPLARVIRRGSTDVEAMQLRFLASSEPMTLTRVVLHAAGSGNDQAAISGVSLYLDGDGDGRVDAGEPLLATATFAQDDGSATFNLSQAIQVGPAVNVLARVSFTQAPFGGDTYELSLNPAVDVQLTSASNAVAISGAPISGAILTAGGGFGVARGAQASPGAPVNQSMQSLAVIQLDMQSVNESCTVQAITLRAAGSIDDRADISAVRLVYDANDNGLYDFTDVAIAPPSTYVQDDGAVSFTGLTRTLGQDVSERWLVIYDLSGSASNLQTLALRLDRPEDLVVSCNISGPVTPLGTPVESEIFTVQEDGALIVSRSPRTPGPLFLSAGTVRVPVLALRLLADVQDLTVRELALVTDGLTVAQLELFLDVNQDGVLDRSEPQLGSLPVGPNGRLAYTGLAISVPTTEAVYLLATVSIASNAVPGSTFQVALAANTDLTAFSALGPALTTGAPLAGDTMTIAGNVNIRASEPPLPQVIHNDASDTRALDLTVAAFSETFTLRALTVTAQGTMEPSADLTRLSLVHESGRVIAEEVRFAEGSNRTTVAGLNERIEAGASQRFYLLADFAGTARIARTFRLSIAANVDVTVEGERLGLTSPVGAPVLGADFTIGPSLSIALGAATPADTIVAANGEHIAAIQLTMSAKNEDVTISRLSLRASGSLDDATAISAVRLLLDAGGDGRVDPGDVEIAAARPAGDDGAITFAPLAERIGKNASASYLVTVDLSGGGSAGQTVRLSLANDGDVTAFGSISGAVFATGAPLDGANVSLVGALNVRLGPASPAGIGVRPGDKYAALQLELYTRGEEVRIDRVQLSLEGSADDAQVIESSTLWRDLDGDGAVNNNDQPIANARPTGNDGPLVFEGVALSILSDGSARLLLEIELAGDADTGGTIRASLAMNEDVRANGTATGPVSAIGAPIIGSAFTVVKKDAAPAGGGQVADGCGCSAVNEENAAENRASAVLIALLTALSALPKLRARCRSRKGR